MPAVDWPAVISGEKRQFRQRRHMAPRFDYTPLPCPVVGFVRESKRDVVRHTGMLVVEEFREREPLLAISPGDLALEGFDTLEEYRRYWRANRRGFRPLDEVCVYTIRPMWPDEAPEFGLAIFHHLYGPWLDEAR